jgi:hypothetical protein
MIHPDQSNPAPGQNKTYSIEMLGVWSLYRHNDLVVLRVRFRMGPSVYILTAEAETAGGELGPWSVPFPWTLPRGVSSADIYDPCSKALTAHWQELERKHPSLPFPSR